MSDSEITQQLRELASSSDKRTVAGRLRILFDEIEATINAGVGRKVIVESLKANGLKITVPVFDNAMSRIRKKRDNQRQKPSASNTMPSTMPTNPAPAELSKASDVAELDERDSADSTDLQRIMNSTPDLVALARLSRKKGITK